MGTAGSNKKQEWWRSLESEWQWQPQSKVSIKPLTLQQPDESWATSKDSQGNRYVPARFFYSLCLWNVEFQLFSFSRKLAQFLFVVQISKKKESIFISILCAVYHTSNSYPHLQNVKYWPHKCQLTSFQRAPVVLPISRQGRVGGACISKCYWLMEFLMEHLNYFERFSDWLFLRQKFCAGPSVSL